MFSKDSSMQACNDKLHLDVDHAKMSYTGEDVVNNVDMAVCAVSRCYQACLYTLCITGNAVWA